MRTRRLASTMAAALIAAAFLGTALLAEAGPPTCLGKRATRVGTSRSDRLTGTSGADVIVGRGGNDVIFGSGGPDRLCGGAGTDVLRGKGGFDRLSGGPGTDTCYPGAGGGKTFTCEKPVSEEGGAPGTPGGGVTCDPAAYPELCPSPSP